jgi:hypothetical protein
MIREAMERGEFDNLEGKGKPLDLDAYFNTPEELRMAFSLLRSNEYVPEEVDMLREIAELKNALRDCPDDEKRAALTKSLHDKTLALNIALEKYKQKR